jgi:hypothetical protein
VIRIAAKNEAAQMSGRNAVILLNADSEDRVGFENSLIPSHDYVSV